LDSLYPKNHGPVSIWAAEIRNVVQVVIAFGRVPTEGLGCGGNGTQGENTNIVTFFQQKSGWPSGESHFIAQFEKRAFALWNGFPPFY